MAWIEEDHQVGSRTRFWIHDHRDGSEVVLPAGNTRAEAELELARYEIRKDLQKYDDFYQELLDRLWGRKTDSDKNTWMN